MSNPAFSEKVMNRINAIEDTSKMTINGTMNKAGFLILLTILGACFGWGMSNPIILIGSLVVGLILCFVIIFNPQRAPVLAPAYAIVEGVLLGSISTVYAYKYPGIVSNALLLTLSILVLMLGLYRFRVIRVTDRLRSVVVGATLAIGLTYLLSFVLGFFGIEIPMIHSTGTYGIIFSLVVVGVASFNLLLDFDMIERAQLSGAPKFMEWYGGFALLVTIVWLYMEVLRLLGKVNKK